MLTGMELLAYWKLRERPFEATWDSRFFYPSRSHNEALHRLHYLVSEGSMNVGMFTGEIGCGKTLTTSVFTERADRAACEVALLENSGFTYAEILTHLLRKLGEDANPSEGRFNLYERFRDAINRFHQTGRHLVIVLDEAQEMEQATLKDLKGLTNLNGGGRNMLTVLLIGQPELREIVGDMPALDQRIGLRFHLRPLNREDTAAYLNHRLQAAGHGGGGVFAPNTLDLIFEATGGVPRELNRVAKLALEHAWVQESSLVSHKSISAVINDRRRHQLVSAP